MFLGIPQKPLPFCSGTAVVSNLPRPLLAKDGLHLSFVFPPLREGKKQEVACHLLLGFGIAGRRDILFICYRFERIAVNFLHLTSSILLLPSDFLENIPARGVFRVCPIFGIFIESQGA